VDTTTRHGTSDPATSPGLGSDKAVNGRCQFEHHEWTTSSTVVKVRSKLLAHQVGAHSNFDLNSCFAQTFNPTASHARVGIRNADDDTRNACSNDGVGAGRRATGVIARLERDEHGRTTCCIACCPQRLHFGVRLPHGLRESTETPTVGGYKDGSDPWVGPARQLRGGGDMHRLAHRLLVDVVHLFLLPSGL
jgi:hypothetical protein